MATKKAPSWYRPGPGCTCVRGQARNQHAGGTAVCWTKLDQERLEEFRAKVLKEKEEAAEEAARKARAKHYRVSWTEQYEKVFEAESEDAAIENRDDEDAFIECLEVTAQEVERCYKAAPGGRKECYGCDSCEGGWRPVVTKEA